MTTINLSGFERPYEGATELQRDIPGEFGFYVQVETEDWDGNPVEPLITVGLPHQCDSWEIAHEEASVSKAYASLSRFVSEAQKALEILAEMKVDESSQGA